VKDMPWSDIPTVTGEPRTAVRGMRHTLHVAVAKPSLKVPAAPAFFTASPQINGENHDTQ
jgi:hypothetical protein